MIMWYLIVYYGTFINHRLARNKVFVYIDASENPSYTFISFGIVEYIKQWCVKAD